MSFQDLLSILCPTGAATTRRGTEGAESSDTGIEPIWGLWLNFILNFGLCIRLSIGMDPDP